MSIDERHIQARNLIMSYGWNSAAYQILNPGMNLWFSHQCNAVVGYVEYGGTRIVAGAPICALSDLAHVVGEFEADARQHDQTTCYFCAGSRLATTVLRTKGAQPLLLGAEPVWTARSFVASMSGKASLRAQCARARNKGLRVRQWSVEELENDLGADSRLQSCLSSWLETRRLLPLHFLIESQTLTQIEDRRIFVAEYNNEVVAYSVLSPIPTRKGWLVEQNVRRPDAPNGTIEVLLLTAAQSLVDEGVEYFTLGLAPLRFEPQSDDGERSYLDYILRSIRVLAQPLYDFEGLRLFKTKFVPDYWEPIYAISAEGRMSLKSLYAVASGFCGGSALKTALASLQRIVTRSVSLPWRY